MAQIELPASTHPFSRADRSRLGLWWWTVDHWLLGAALALIGLGVLLSFGSSPAAASRLDITFPFHFAVRQSIFALAGVVVLLGVSVLSPRGVRRSAFFIYIVTIALMIALIFLYLSNRYLGLSIGGLFSPDYATAPWSPARVLDLLKHLWIPVIIVGTSGTASLIRITRANVIDELRKPYVETARAKGLPRLRLILKYPVRIALNPFISSMGFVLPAMISGEIIVSIVLNLPTTGPLLYGALLAQDMYLAGSFVMLLAILTVIGVLISDILLAWLDPRVRYE